MDFDFETVELQAADAQHRKMNVVAAQMKHILVIYAIQKFQI
jgi:hypothetical protein